MVDPPLVPSTGKVRIEKFGNAGLGHVASDQPSAKGDDVCVIMLARKPRMLVSVALANKMARMVWALLIRNEDYRAPAAVAA